MTIAEKVEICRKLLNDNGNRFCHVWFTKKTTGELRRMTIHRSKKLEASVTGMHPIITAKANDTLAKRDMIRVEEFTRDENGSPIHQWRTLTLPNIQRLAINGAVLDFTK